MLKFRFNAEGSRVIIAIVQVGAAKNICTSSAGARERGNTG